MWHDYGTLLSSPGLGEEGGKSGDLLSGHQEV